METRQTTKALIGTYIRSRRIARGMTQKELALAARITARWLSAVERGRAKRLTLDHLDRIFDALGVQIEDWFDPTPTSRTRPD